jgi:long-chain fatty acid transport protein
MRRLTIAATVVVLALAVGTTPALATNGYFSHGYGTHYKGLAGAGVALPLDTLAPATNPAAMAFLGPRWDVGLAVFNPNRYYGVDGAPSGFPGTFGLTPGLFESGSRYFYIPHVGANFQAGRNGTLGFAVYGNGGMNTDWPNETFYAGPAGVNLSQLFVAPTYALKLSRDHALGVSVIGAVQWFEGRGVASFTPFSTDPAHLSDNGKDYSYGGGLRLGYLGHLSDYLSVGASYQTRVWMTGFDSYSGLFADEGQFDIPSNWVVGIAVKPTESLDIVLDVQQVRYSEVKSINNALLPAIGMCGLGDSSACLGTSTGSGFGWDDMTTIKGGVQLRTGDTWTWRAGYSWGEQPIPETEVLFNILAPGVMEQHLTFGFSKRLGTQEISFTVMRALSNQVLGANPLEAPGRQMIDLEMNQWEFEIGWGFGIRR